MESHFTCKTYFAIQVRKQTSDFREGVRKEECPSASLLANSGEPHDRAKVQLEPHPRDLNANTTHDLKKKLLKLCRTATLAVIVGLAPLLRSPLAFPARMVFWSRTVKVCIRAWQLSLYMVEFFLLASSILLTRILVLS